MTVLRQWKSSLVRQHRRDGEPVGIAFLGFVVVILGLAGLALLRDRIGLASGPSASTGLGAIAATVYGVAGIIAASQAIRRRLRSTSAIALVLLGPGAVWCWLLFVNGAGTGVPTTVVVTLAAGALSIALLVEGLRFAHWLDVYAGLGAMALVLVTNLVRADPVGAVESPFVALVAAVGGMASLYGILADLEVAESRLMIELRESKRQIEAEMRRAEDVLHDLRSGLLAIEAATASFDGELAEPLRSEAARLRRLTVRGHRSVEVFELVDRVRDLVQTRRAGGITVDLRAPASAKVWGEQSEVLAIVENLLSNAERHGNSTPIVVEISGHADRTKVAVANNGDTLGDVDLERIFDRGVSTHTAGQGIGLSRAKVLAALNGGDLAVEPSMDGRTVFMLDLLSGPPRALA